MPTKPRKQNGEDDSYARVTRPFLLQEVKCHRAFDKFNEEAQIGSIIGIAGNDFAIIAVDTHRTDDAYHALHRLTKKLIFGQTGSQCVASYTASDLRARLFVNEFHRKREIPTECVALLMSDMKKKQQCSYKQPSAMLAGLDHCGKGAIFTFNPLGFHERVTFRALGAASAVLQPILMKNLTPKPPTKPRNSSAAGSLAKDGSTRLSESWLSNSVDAIETGSKNCVPTATKAKSNQTKAQKINFNEAFELIVDAFRAAACDRYVYTGDMLVLEAITKKGCFKHEIILKSPRRDSIESWL